MVAGVRRVRPRGGVGRGGWGRTRSAGGHGPRREQRAGLIIERRGRRPRGVLKPYDAQRLAGPSRRAALSCPATPPPPKVVGHTPPVLLPSARGARAHPPSERGHGGGATRAGFLSTRGPHTPEVWWAPHGRRAPTDNAAWQRPRPDTSASLRAGDSAPPFSHLPAPFPEPPPCPFPAGQPSHTRRTTESSASHGQPCVAAPQARRARSGRGRENYPAPRARRVVSVWRDRSATADACAAPRGRADHWSTHQHETGLCRGVAAADGPMTIDYNTCQMTVQGRRAGGRRRHLPQLAGSVVGLVGHRPASASPHGCLA